ncbi:HD-GYP domain-containing protein [Bacillus sp. 2205SS5-2]|uniref:HD-GYP domain-containing protein n=1 Tax=Bacillus sp. 2205SS5-2 TaxID=3109031 RepID=UPI00300405DD
MEQLHISFDLVDEILGEDIFSQQGILLLKKGIILSESHILLLQNHKFGQTISMEKKSTQKTLPLKSKNENEYDDFTEYLASEFQKIQDGFSLANIPVILKKFSALEEKTHNDIAITTLFQKQSTAKNHLIQHSIHVGLLASQIGKVLSYSRLQCQLLAQMGLLHDIGMLKISQKISKKTDSLTTNEWEEIKSHPTIGYDLLKNVPYISPLISQAALLHHERVDGSGYPMKVNERKIHLLIQIISVADTFNAICSHRTYSSNQSYFTAVTELMNEVHNNKLNPAIVIPFVRYIMRQHLRQQVELDTGEIAEIIFIHENEPHQPLIKLNEEFIDLRKHPTMKIVKPGIM